ncbi:hypothetical protein DMP16_02890 [Sulfolobus sp. B1]|uniref:hypothetical protein n=1 Tax=Sulfolobus sp. B1 TaxID=2200888 RepID=UPI00117C3F21|nr:hypothetical protein [Sulfolobus sp. B1]TRM97381.1 hypothetical protein DMP16_02890 [Sulfolobus sp. B1]
MKTDSLTIEGKKNALILSWAKNIQNLISILPNVVSVENNTYVKFRFSRFLLFSFESKFSIKPGYFGDKIIEYKLVDQKGNTFKILFTVENDDKVRISIAYSGEKEWIVGNALHNILSELRQGIEKEISRYEVQPQLEDYSHKLAKMSYLTKLIIKSKLIDTEEVTVTQGGLVDYLQQIVAQYAQYPVIYVSGTGSSTFRVLLINGELKGVYILDNNKEYFGEEEVLNKLVGEFKLNIYVMISPKALEVLQ